MHHQKLFRSSTARKMALIAAGSRRQAADKLKDEIKEEELVNVAAE